MAAATEVLGAAISVVIPAGGVNTPLVAALAEPWTMTSWSPVVAAMDGPVTEVPPVVAPDEVATTGEAGLTPRSRSAWRPCCRAPSRS
jgi:hypothetical protein